MALSNSAPRVVPHLGVNIDRALKAIPGFEDAALAVSRGIHNAVLKGGKSSRTVADVLHGVWLGHSLHAVLVEVPVGAWSASAVFDLIALASGSEKAAWAADALILFGVLGAVPAAMAGMADYSAIKKDAAAEGLAHATLNSAALGVFLLSLAARRNGQRGKGVALSLAALTISGASAWLGGDLVYRHRVGVNHTPAPDPVGGWIAVLGSDELAVGESRRVMVGDSPVMVHRSPEAIYAIGAVCAHAGGPLEEGTVSGGCVECPWHQSIFDLRDGRVVHGPSTQPQPSYDVRVQGGLIELRLPDGARAPFERDAGDSQQRAVGGSR